MLRHRGEGGAGGALAPPLFWLIKLLFQFFSKVLHKKVHRVILCQTCGPQRKHCFFLIAPFRSNIVFWCLSRQFAEFLVRSRRSKSQTLKFPGDFLPFCLLSLA